MKTKGTIAHSNYTMLYHLLQHFTCRKKTYQVKLFWHTTSLQEKHGKWVNTFSQFCTVENPDKCMLLILLNPQVVNKLMYSCSADHTAKCWVVEFGDCTRTYKGHKHTIHSLFFQEGLCKFSSNKFVVRESNKCVETQENTTC